MLEFTTHKYFLFTRKEFWFYDGEKIKEGAYNVFSVAKKTYGANNNFLEKYKTSIIDLSKSEEELFNAIHPTFRYDIRAAEKQKIEYKTFVNPTKSECINLVHDYNLFAKSKQLPLMNMNRILTIQKSGNIYITKALLQGNEISTHIYIFDKNVISLMTSFHNINFSTDKLRSEANKYLHWKDILLFKTRNFKQYDFGGLNLEKLPGVSKFKMNFGGETVENIRFIKTSFFIYFLMTLYKIFRKI